MRPICALLACGLLLGACGGSEPAVRAAGNVVDLELRDFRMAPQRVAARRGEITFSVINRGRLPHNLHVKGPGGSRIEISTMLPGRGGQAAKRFPRGTYRLVCTIANHEELGLYGALIVR